MLSVLGKGNYGKVLLVEKKDTKELFVMKKLNKKNILEEKMIERMKTERFILGKVLTNQIHELIVLPRQITTLWSGWNMHSRRPITFSL